MCKMNDDGGRKLKNWRNTKNKNNKTITIRHFFLCMYLYHQYYVIITIITLRQDLPQDVLELAIQPRLT